MTPAQTPSGSPNLSDSWMNSLKAEATGKYDDALKLTETWQKAGGNRYLAQLRTGWLFLLKKDYPKAAAAYEEAAKLNSSALTPLYGLLSVAQAQDSAEKVRSASEQILRIEPTNLKALMALAYSSYLATDYRRAQSYYRKALAIYPENTEALSGAAWSAYYLGDKALAFNSFQFLISINPNYPYAKRGMELCQVNSPGH